jgi:hypothetical protein
LVAKWRIQLLLSDEIPCFKRRAIRKIRWS